MPQDAAATRRPFFQAKRAKINEIRVIHPAIQPDTFNMLKNPKNVTLFAKKIKKITALHFRRAVLSHYLKTTLVLYVTPVTIFWNLSIKI